MHRPPQLAAHGLQGGIELEFGCRAQHQQVQIARGACRATRHRAKDQGHVHARQASQGLAQHPHQGAVLLHLKGGQAKRRRQNLIRDQKVLNDYRLGSLKREKDDAQEVRDGMECGIRLEGFNDVKEGDLLEAYRIDEIKRTLN